ncbi:uncharacterized protein LOC121891725 [Thunnus maccoyii]|uniref:uncharacterized protein LOC121891725 n=1 Tax=Thunnus maccoyii TaxID=8240 RepID=UPI001C4B3775|nr:uncharacterized protein LOC121891725 [Thunnus maccoyii]
MELLWMILPVFLVCAEAENVTEVKAELGQNVTLTCSVEVSDIYWYMEIHNQFRVLILRTFDKTDNNPNYCNPEFKTKYSVLENSLVITNVTAEDFRCYFCARRQYDRIRFEGTISLVSDSITPSNNCKPNNNQQRIQGIWQSQTILFSSFALNGLLVLLVIGSSFTYLYLKRNDSKYQVNEPSPLTSENPETPEAQKTCFHQVETGSDSVFNTTCVYRISSNKRQ